MTASITTFRAALPQFTMALVADQTLQLYLDMAGRRMGGDTSDTADDKQTFLAAHIMSLAGIGPGSQAGDLAGFASIKAGSLTLTRAEKAQAGEFSATQYGILYWMLARADFGTGIFVTGSGAALNGYGAYPHGQD